MKEFKVLAVVLVVVAALYIGVEPFAHSYLHKKVAPADFSFKDLEKNTLSGNIANGKNLIVNNYQCQSCHSISSQKLGASVDLGVMAPDLSNAGAIYDKKFLFNLIKNPAVATQTTHKFSETTPHPMPTAKSGGISDQDIADIVSYLISIAPKIEDVTNKEVFVQACQRCHGIKYADMVKKTMGPLSDVKPYLGVTPPDLSQYIRSRSKSYLSEFINQPNKHLEGTAMPRVGLNKDAQAKVIMYLEEVGDSKKAERESMGIYFLLYLLILAIFAWAWKIKVWKEVH